MTIITRHRTALKRLDFSRPVRLAVEAGLISKETTFFDYGCGHGDDVQRLRMMDIPSSGWDPVHRPDSRRESADVVNLGYVVNVIEDPRERETALRAAWELAYKILIVSARLTTKNQGRRHTPYEDGYVTSVGTFQKFYAQHELRAWIDSTLGVSSVPAAPGVFYVFRDPVLGQSYVASGYRRHESIPRVKRSDLIFEQYRGLLEPLMAFLAERGRLPDISESEVARSVVKEIGSLKKAYSIINKVTGEKQWESIRDERSQDLLIYLALARFGGRPRMSELPTEVQLDVRAFFTTYRHACDLADALLFSTGKPDVVQNACRKSAVGKITSDSIYVHTSALSNLPPVLRVYEGCARNYIGIVEGANIIKLSLNKPQVSYLYYPEFERDPHPALAASLVVPLRSFHISYRDYTETKNPFILHRKECFISKEHALYSRFAKLTKQEESFGLYDTPELIGTREGWEKVLRARCVEISGHRARLLRDGDT